MRNIKKTKSKINKVFQANNINEHILHITSEKININIFLADFNFDLSDFLDTGEIDIIIEDMGQEDNFFDSFKVTISGGAGVDFASDLILFSNVFFGNRNKVIKFFRKLVYIIGDEKTNKTVLEISNFLNSYK